MVGEPGMMVEGPMDGIDPMALDAEAPTLEGDMVVDRDSPEPTEQRKALVDSLTKMVKEAKAHWDKSFKNMEKDQRFCAGEQWPSETKASLFNDDFDDRYIANITMRTVQQKVASLYCKNPKAVCRRRQKLLSTVWDGSMQTLMAAQQTMQKQQMAQQAMMAMGASILTGAPPPGMPGMAPPPPGPDGAPGPMQPMPMPPMPPDPVEVQEAEAVIADAKQAKQQLDISNKIARTLELLYEYEISEQQQPFKSMMKMVVRRAATAGVGWVRLGFQRVMGKNPDFDSRIADIQQRLSTLERISADIADGETEVDSAEAEQLELLLLDMQSDSEIVVREGLIFSYPKSTAIIPDPRCVQLRDFLGCDWVCEEFMLTPNEIQETYGVDVGKDFVAYNRLDSGTDYERARAIWSTGTFSDDAHISDGDSESALVWEVYNKKDGLVYTICDGYKDFLRRPAQPEFYTDRFWPWFVVAFNECDGKVYPPSDVSLMRPMQLELNRSRQGLREHRLANRPKIVYAEGLLSEDDLDALRNHPVNALISISGLQPSQNVDQVLQPLKGVPLDPNLYQTQSIFEDMMRAVGTQEANLGATSGSTATETNLAQSSRASALGSAVDDIDETLTAMARAAGQILLLNVSEETVKSIVGPGAMWPTLTKAEVSKELMLEIEAGSSGRPNQAQELQNYERLAPILMQIPGINPLVLAKEAIKRLDDRIDVEAAVAEGMPSIQSMNAMKGPPQVGAPGPAGPPQAQGPQGGNNAPTPPPPSPSSPSPKPQGAPQGLMGT
jgi:hypothetical protein